ncbi:MAG: hypothetical protein V1859_04115 [archaeon]
MTYAIKIIEPAFQKTKESLFPVDKKYWLRMGLVSLASAGNYAGNGGNPMGDGSSLPDTGNLSFREIVAKFNIEALQFLKIYGWIIGVLFAILYIFSLVVSYINSVLYFVFIEGVIQKKIEVRKSFSANRAIGTSLFLFRTIFGLISLAAYIICLYPVIDAFLNNRLAYFNLWLLIPMIIGIVIFSVFFGIISFIVEDFLIVIMYLKKLPIGASFTYFKRIASGKTLEIFLYWLMKIPLGIFGAIISGIIMLFLAIPYVVLCIFFVLIGIVIYLISKALLIPLIVIGLLLFTAIIMLFIYNLSVFLLPIRFFSQNYAILMVEELDGKNIEHKNANEETAEKKNYVPSYTSESAEKKAIKKIKKLRKNN